MKRVRYEEEQIVVILHEAAAGAPMSSAKRPSV
jgi:hypothetical protein